MGSLSVSTHRRLVHWQGLLVVVSLLMLWSLPTTAQLSIVSTYCAEGEDALLRIHNKPPEAIAYVWYKGKDMNNNNVIAFFIMTLNLNLSGPENKGREMITDDGSLLLKKVTMKDAGMYTVVVHLPDSKKEIGFGQLDVYEHLRVPVLLASSYGVVENEDDVVLTCYMNGKFPQWFLNDMKLKLTNRMKLSGDGRRLTINPVEREDAGVYKCRGSNPIMWVESQPLVLQVLHQ